MASDNPLFFMHINGSYNLGIFLEWRIDGVVISIARDKSCNTPSLKVVSLFFATKEELY